MRWVVGGEVEKEKEDGMEGDKTECRGGEWVESGVNRVSSFNYFSWR